MQFSFICILLIQNKPFSIAEQMMMNHSLFYEVKDSEGCQEAGKNARNGGRKAHQEGHDDVLSATRNAAISIRIRLT